MQYVYHHYAYISNKLPLFTWKKVDKGKAKAIDEPEGDLDAGLSPRVCY